ncbi:hypothetical protein GcM3_012022 [Golovinomyces cichoracearum]|uniref:CCHC-type domain-containing protein n=1 Tax=Golovinomyces cichoracearum TaxID=62708 RepID=A0A420J9N6_9PEZI|nr:hypothetical protein GcM3_012022 [Golovinomyces cichoracearum]
MQQLDMLHDPTTNFARLRPNDNESAKKFAWRMRAAYYRLSGIDRYSDPTRAAMKDIVSTHLPRVWTLAHPHSISCNNHELIEMIVQITAQVDRWPAEDRKFPHPHEVTNTTSLSLEMPSFDAIEKPTIQLTFIAHENNFYSCGKPGHFAKNCSKVQSSANQTPAHKLSKLSTIKYDNWKNKIAQI